MKTEKDSNNNEETWGRTDNEAYVWENDGHQEHHAHLGKDSKRSDSTIQEDISKLLTADNFVDASNILVEVAKGVVKLSGSVLEQNDKERAEDFAKAVPGVIRIENAIRIEEANKTSSEHHYKTLIHSASASPKSVF